MGFSQQAAMKELEHRSIRRHGARGGMVVGGSSSSNSQRPSVQEKASPSVPQSPGPSEERFFKTKLCAFWVEGRCLRGSGCKYAHGEEEMHIVPDLTKTALCRNLLNGGKCTSEDCPFAHNIEELRGTEDVYKTSMCSFFRFGRCRMGAFCRHAHFESELRQRKRTIEEPSRGRAEVTEDSDDEIGDLPNFSWARTNTMPPSVGQVGNPQSAQPQVIFGRYLPPSAPVRQAGTSSKLLSNEDLEAPQDSYSSDDDFDLEPAQNMWQRMQTAPPSVLSMSQQVLNTNQRYFQRLPSVKENQDLVRCRSLSIDRNKLKMTRAPSYSYAESVGSQNSSTCLSECSGNNFSDVSSCSPYNTCSPKVQGLHTGMPVMAVAMMPVMLLACPNQQQAAQFKGISGGASQSCTALFEKQISMAAQLPAEQTEQLLRDAAPDHYED
jgi:hypothetical protein